MSTIGSNAGATADLAEPLHVRDIGSFHVGGHMLSLTGMTPRLRVSTAHGAVHPIDPNGEIIVAQMYVQYVKLAAPRGRHPLLLWHGGGMSGVNWGTTPDGRPGWQMFFLRAGFDVFVSDAVERGRVSWAPYPDVYPEAPYFRTARGAWEETFRFGPADSWHAEPPLPRFGCSDGTRDQTARTTVLLRRRCHQAA
jgi:hypothetical protein